MVIEYGDIVIVENLLDPQGRNPKTRPAVVMTPTDQIIAGGPLYVIGITTTLTPRPTDDDFVALPWHADRHPRTGLDKRNAAVCRWLAYFDRTQVLRVIGHLPPRKLERIKDKVRNMRS